MQRPEFDSIKDYAEFSKYYWYRDELIKICKAHGLKSDGTKIELNKVIEAYFSGEKINVDMVASVKAVKECGDESFTLGDLLDIYYGKKTYATYDKSALQWNKFVKDFCEDEATKIFPERLKAAAELWKIVRESDMKKEYSHDLFVKYKDDIMDERFFMIDWEKGKHDDITGNRNI